MSLSLHLALLVYVRAHASLTPFLEAKKTVSNTAIVASWRGLVSRENARISAKNARVAEHNFKLHFDASLPDAMKHQRAKGTTPIIKGLGSHSFCQRFKKQFGLTKKTSHQGRKERDYDDPVMEDNRNEVRAILSSAFTVPALLFNVDETWRRTVQSDKETSLIEKRNFTTDQSAVENLVVQIIKPSQDVTVCLAEDAWQAQGSFCFLHTSCDFAGTGFLRMCIGLSGACLG